MSTRGERSGGAIFVAMGAESVAEWWIDIGGRDKARARTGCEFDQARLRSRSVPLLTEADVARPLTQVSQAWEIMVLVWKRIVMFHQTKAGDLDDLDISGVMTDCVTMLTPHGTSQGGPKSPHQ